MLAARPVPAEKNRAAPHLCGCLLYTSAQDAQETLKDAEVKYNKDNPTTNPDGSETLDGVIVTNPEGSGETDPCLLYTPRCV